LAADCQSACDRDPPNIHDLRHTFASLLISNGEDIVRVSRLMGHATASFTLNVYSHMLPREHDPSGDRLASFGFWKQNGNCCQSAKATWAAERGKLQRISIVRMVARGGIEPPTRGFSVRCSTN